MECATFKSILSSRRLRLIVSCTKDKIERAFKWCAHTTLKAFRLYIMYISFVWYLFFGVKVLILKFLFFFINFHQSPNSTIKYSEWHQIYLENFVFVCLIYWYIMLFVVICTVKKNKKNKLISDEAISTCFKNWIEFVKVVS